MQTLPDRRTIKPAMHTAAVITVSDSCHKGTRNDLTGPAVRRALKQAGFHVEEHTVVPDEVPQILEAMRHAMQHASLVVTTGGTGVALRDVTPEATKSLITREIPGLSEKMRVEGLEQTPRAALSRGICGTVQREDGTGVLIVNLPGSSAGALSSLNSILALVPHILDLMAGHTAHPANPVH